MDPRAEDIGLDENEWQTVVYLCKRFAREDLSQLFSPADLEQESLCALFKFFKNYANRGEPIINRRYMIYLVVKRRLTKLLATHLVPAPEETEETFAFYLSPPRVSEGEEEDTRVPQDTILEDGTIQVVDDLGCRGWVQEALKDKEWQLIEQLFWKGRSQREVAQELGVAESTISSRKKRALDRMREKYAKGDDC